MLVKRLALLLVTGLCLLLTETSFAAAAADDRGSSAITGGRYFSPLLRTDFIPVTEEEQILSHIPIIVDSEQFFPDSLLLTAGEHYYLDYQVGRFRFTDAGFKLLSGHSHIAIEYAVFPPSLKRQFRLFESFEITDTLAIKTLSSRTTRFAFPETNLDISGSKSFGVSIGSDEDFNINQSLFLRIDGELRPNLNIQAQLSDSQSPFTPEGDTKEISSLDQIFIRLYGKIPAGDSKAAESVGESEYEIAFGDLELFFGNTRFLTYRTQFEGVKAEWRGRNEFKGALALSRGKQSTNEFRGVDGKQGPYYLRLSGIGTYLQVIPGSEEVFLDGLRMERGTDYRINYSEGSISFTQRHFINSNSLIYVRFQYSDEEYRKHNYMSGNSIAITDRLRAGFYLVAESDDKDNPLRGELTPQERRVLQEAGDGVAWVDGVIEVGEGEGEYLKENGYYVYKGFNQGNYIIHFSFVGTGRGSYRQISPGRFEYKGEGEGDWIPLKRLTAPEFKANYDVSLQWTGDFWQIEGEGLYSRYDRNTFSDKDSNNNDGYAAHGQVSITPESDRIASELIVYYRLLSRNLHTFTDISDPSLQYSLVREVDIDSVDVSEYGSEMRLAAERLWHSQVRLYRRSGAGTDKNDDMQKESFVNDNLLANLSLQAGKFHPAVNYGYRYYDSSVSEDATSGLDDEEQTIRAEIKARQENHHLNIRQYIYRLSIGGDYNYRHYRQESSVADDVGVDKSVYTSKRVNISTHRTHKIAGNLFLGRDENEEISRDEKTGSEALTFGGEVMADAYGQRLRTTYSHRRITALPDETESFYDMAEINFNSSLFAGAVNTAANYALINMEFFPKVRELIYVGRNVGVYDSTGVFSEDGEYDYITILSGDSEMSAEINAELNLYLTPSRIIKQNSEPATGFTPTFVKWLGRIQTESSLIRSENSRSDDRWNLYLLRSGSIMNQETTIFGRTMERHTFWLDLIPRRMLLKLMTQNDQTLDNRYNESFETEMNAQEVMLRLSRFVGSDFELSYEVRRDEESRYSSEINSHSYSLDIRNRIGNSLNLATMLRYTLEEGGRQNDDNFDYKLHGFSIAETASLFLQRRYRFFGRFEYRYNKREGSGFLTFMPEKRGGNVFRWSSRLNYQLNQFTTATLSYAGQKYPLQKSVHTMKVDFRAEF